MALTTRLTNDYAAWTRESPWALYDSDTKIELLSTSGTLTKRTYKTFALTNPAKASAITIWGKTENGDPDVGSTCVVKLIKPDASIVTIGSIEPLTDWTKILDALDITSNLNQAGTYTLELWGTVDYGYTSSEAHYGTLLLQVDDTLPSKITGVSAHAESTSQVHVSWTADAEADSYTVYFKKTTDTVWSYTSLITDTEAIIGSLDSAVMYDFKVAGYNDSGEGEASDEVEMRPLGTLTATFEESSTATEDFTETRIGLATVQDTLTLTEDFSVQVLSTTPTSTIIFLCGYTGSKVYTFEPGLILGTYDTGEIHFGHPDKEKTLCEIRFGSESETPHTILVYVSTDGGSVWTLIGSDLCGLGRIGFVYPWLTSHRFLVRFTGNGLHLFFYEIYAIPSGWKIRT